VIPILRCKVEAYLIASYVSRCKRLSQNLSRAPVCKTKFYYILYFELLITSFTTLSIGGFLLVSKICFLSNPDSVNSSTKIKHHSPILCSGVLILSLLTNISFSAHKTIDLYFKLFEIVTHPFCFMRKGYIIDNHIISISKKVFC